MRSTVALLVVLAVVIGGIVAVDRIPPQHSPLAPLDLEQPVGVATGWKMARLRYDPAVCRDVLARSLLDFLPLPDRDEGAFCRLRDTVLMERSPSGAWPPVRVTCAMAAALHVWQREVVAVAAAHHYNAKGVRIEPAGTYSCRFIRDSTGRPSEHATANAIDVLGFRMSDGRRVSVLSGWSGSPTDRAFLREVRDGSCRLFRGVLSPDYNAAHRDHFHLDMGPYDVCR